MNWLESSDAKSTENRTIDCWKNLRSSLEQGTFWADRITKLRDQPIERLQLAIENLPLPGAFREAAIAMRTLIRSRLKRKENYLDELILLYWVAAIESFAIPYSNFMNQPGFNVMESIPGSVIKSLPFTYQELGYKQLGLLNKTDCKWLVATWGEPAKHTTLNEVHKELWHKYEIELLERQAQKRASLWQL